MAQLLQLLELGELHFELQRRAALAASQRHEQPGAEPVRARGFDLAVNQLERPVPVRRLDIVGKAGEKYG